MDSLPNMAKALDPVDFASAVDACCDTWVGMIAHLRTDAHKLRAIDRMILQLRAHCDADTLAEVAYRIAPSAMEVVHPHRQDSVLRRFEDAVISS